MLYRRALQRVPENRNGLVLHWTFDEGVAYDSSGFNNVGTLVSSPKQGPGIVRNAEGKHGAFSFVENSGQKITMSSSASLPTGNSNYTIAFWFNGPIPAAGSTIGWWIIGWGTTGTTNLSNNVYVLKTSGFLQVDWWNNSKTGTINIGTSQWRHVATTFDGTTRRIYVDGRQDTSDTPAGHNTTGTMFSIGLGTNFTFSIGAGLDDVRIYNRALSAAEIYALYATALLPPEEYELPSLFTPPPPFIDAVGSPIFRVRMRERW